MSFPTKRVMNVHRSRHAKEANASTADRINAAIAPAREQNSTVNKVNDLAPALESECTQWQTTFSSHESNETFDEKLFDKNVTEFLKFLFKANEKMPGPKHPAVKFYRLRKKGKKNITSAQYERSTNPQRTDKKAKQKRSDKYQYDLTQYWFYNQRRKAVLEVTKTGNLKQCNIKMNVIEEHFKKLFDTPNERIRESYPAKERKEDVFLQPKDIQLQIKRISLDTSAGPDRVLARTIRQLNVSNSICSIANVMLHSSYVPTCFRNGRTILADKGDDESEIGNWRPITIFSVVRRVVEKALESVLRTQVEINWNQRGFVIGVPGCHINSRLINACLKKAKRNKTRCVILFLDVSKAFDRIGHDRSPILFNLAINYIYDELCDSQYADQYGYKLSNNFDALSLLGFADDQAIAGKNKVSAVRSTDAVRILLSEIGLKVNTKKSQAINIENGQLIEDTLTLSNRETIATIKSDDRIRYLGCSFNSELVFDNMCVERLNTTLNNLASSPLLKPDQKLNIINQYVFPTLTYPLQSAPINKIPKYVTDGLDVMIRRTVKEIIGLPMRTNDNLLINLLIDFFGMPQLVRDVNDDPKFIEQFKESVRKNQKPPFSTNKFLSQILITYLWCQIFIMAIPEEEVSGINFRYLHWLTPFVVALGVWSVGNVGRHRGSIWKCLFAAYAAYPLRYVIYEETYWLTIVIIVSTIVFENYSKQWRLTSPKRRSKTRRLFTLSLACCLCLALFGSYFYFNAKITDGEGDEVPVHEAVSNFFKSPFWTDLKKSLDEIWNFAKHHGFYETWRQMIDMIDVDGEQNAYKTLGLHPTATQSEITAAFRKLSKENHPDKVKGEAEKKIAQEKFMEISSAYEVLSKIKSKRKRNNKRSTTNDDL